MKDLKTINKQLERALRELTEINNEENQLIYDYIEYANMLVKKLILSDVGSSGNLLKRKQEVSKSIENFKKACENYTKSKEYKEMIKAFEKLKAFR